MGFDRLGKKRTKRTQTWASVCIGLFAGRNRTTDERADADTADEAT